MKKIITSLNFFIFTVHLALAQIPDASFESWSGSTPSSWLTGDNTGGVTQSANTHAGSYAAKINIVDLGAGTKTSGSLKPKSSGAFHVTTTPEALHGWYIFNNGGSDKLSVSTIAANVSNTYGATENKYFTATSVYKEFVVNYDYSGTGSVDSVSISILITNYNNSSYGQHIASYAIIDDLSFGPILGIDEKKSKDNFNLEDAYPNPSNEISTIVYNLSATAEVSAAVYDITGSCVKNMINRLEQTPGRYKIIVNTNELNSGIYCYRFTVDGVSQTKKLIVTY